MHTSLVLALTDDNFDQQVLASDRPTLVDFGAVWCPPCRAIRPVIDALAEQYKERIHIGVLDVDDSQRIAERYGVRSVPAFLLFDRGAIVAQLVGAGPTTRKRLEAAFASALQSHRLSAQQP